MSAHVSTPAAVVVEPLTSGLLAYVAMYQQGETGKTVTRSGTCQPQIGEVFEALSFLDLLRPLYIQARGMFTNLIYEYFRGPGADESAPDLANASTQLLRRARHELPPERLSVSRVHHLAVTPGYESHTIATAGVIGARGAGVAAITGKGWFTTSLLPTDSVALAQWGAALRGARLFPRGSSLVLISPNDSVSEAITSFTNGKKPRTQKWFSSSTVNLGKNILASRSITPVPISSDYLDLYEQAHQLAEEVASGKREPTTTTNRALQAVGTIVSVPGPSPKPKPKPTPVPTSDPASFELAGIAIGHQITGKIRVVVALDNQKPVQLTVAPVDSEEETKAIISALEGVLGTGKTYLLSVEGPPIPEIIEHFGYPDPSFVVPREFYDRIRQLRRTAMDLIPRPRMNYPTLQRLRIDQDPPPDPSHVIVTACPDDQTDGFVTAFVTGGGFYGSARVNAPNIWTAHYAGAIEAARIFPIGSPIKFHITDATSVDYLRQTTALETQRPELIAVGSFGPARNLLRRHPTQFTYVTEDPLLEPARTICTDVASGETSRTIRTDALVVRYFDDDGPLRGKGNPRNPN
jgi:hypothetical protein